MARTVNDRINRRLGEAEGFLMLGLPQRALDILQAPSSDWSTMPFEANFLTGEALRALDRFRDALKPLETAAALRPSDVGAAIALGWCYKRTHRLAQAVDALERAKAHHPDEAILHYNLACYWSLAGHPSNALAELAVAITLDDRYVHAAPDEPDFAPLRGHPEFERLVSGKAPKA